jgi:ribosomal protein L7Ae-like RNA K-turn-binding protein
MQEEIRIRKLKSMLGIAAKAGKVESGGFCSENCIKSGKAFLVICAENASDRTKKTFKDMCAFRNVTYREVFDKDTLGHVIGKEERTSVAVKDEKIAAVILSLIDVQ